MGKKLVIIFLILFILLALVFSIKRNFGKGFSDADALKDIILIGEYECLPHKVTNGPTTLECALGIKGENGIYYALDTSGVSESVQNLEKGKKVKLNGILIPIEAISSDYWQKYDIKGIIRVQTLQKL